MGEASGDIARSAAIAADYGFQVPGIQINRFCASGLDAVAAGAAGHGGPEGSRGRRRCREHEPRRHGCLGHAAGGGPERGDPLYFSPQGVAADFIATKYGFSRDDVDALAVASHKKAAAAWAEGRFAKSVVPVKDVNGLTILAKDETIRPNTDMQTLAASRPPSR